MPPIYWAALRPGDEMIKKYSDIISGGVFLLFSLILLAMSQKIEVSTISEYGGSIVPQGIAVLMAILSFLVVVGGVKKLKADKPGSTDEIEADVDSRNKGFIPLAGIIIVSAMYVFLLNSIGFIIMTSICLSCQMFILSGLRRKKIPLFIIVSTLFTLGIEYVFVNVFYLMLPSGILG